MLTFVVISQWKIQNRLFYSSIFSRKALGPYSVSSDLNISGEDLKKGSNQRKVWKNIANQRLLDDIEDFVEYWEEFKNVKPCLSQVMLI